MKKLTVMVDDALYRATKIESAKSGRPLREIVAEALAEWLEVQEDHELGLLADEAMAEYEAKGGVAVEDLIGRAKSHRKSA
jgi:hypothetical protein